MIKLSTCLRRIPQEPCEGKQADKAEIEDKPEITNVRSFIISQLWRVTNIIDITVRIDELSITDNPCLLVVWEHIHRLKFIC